MTDARNLRTPSETIMSMEGQQNAGGERRQNPGSSFVYYDAAPLSEYPRMMYRKTDQKQTQEYADAVGLKDEPMVTNSFDGLLCDTTIANTLDEAEALSAEGWETSARAAHGLATGIKQAASAKDDEIAALRAELARRDERDAQLIPATTPAGAHVDLVGEPPRRGPGRPPKSQE